MKLTGLEVDVIELGSALGSDVPFFAGGFSHAVVRGRGELVEGCSVPEFHAVLVSSGERIPTPVAYSLWDEGGGHLTEPWQISNYTALNFGVWHEGKPFPVRLDNDFLPVLSRRFPGVERAAGILSETCVNWGSAVPARCSTPCIHTRKRRWRPRKTSAGSSPGFSVVGPGKLGRRQMVKTQGFGPCIGGSNPPAPASFPGN